MRIHTESWTGPSQGHCVTKQQMVLSSVAPG